MLLVKFIRKIGALESNGYIIVSFNRVNEAVKTLIKTGAIITSVEYIKEA